MLNTALIILTAFAILVFMPKQDATATPPTRATATATLALADVDTIDRQAVYDALPPQVMATLGTRKRRK